MVANLEFKGTLMEYFKEQNDLKRLINILNNIDSSAFNIVTNNGVISEIHGCSKEIALVWALAEELLITEDGECNWQNINELKQMGYEVFPGINDGVGWLTGCIKTKKGILIYG